jgi:hypothetical protein
MAHVGEVGTARDELKREIRARKRVPKRADPFAHERRLGVAPLVEMLDGIVSGFLADARRTDGDAVQNLLDLRHQCPAARDGADAIAGQAVCLREAEQLHQAFPGVSAGAHESVRRTGVSPKVLVGLVDYQADAPARQKAVNRFDVGGRKLRACRIAG